CVWEQCAALVTPDRVLLVEGKLENENGEPKILADRVSEVFIEYEENGQEIDPYLCYLPDEENGLNAAALGEMPQTAASPEETFPPRISEASPSYPGGDADDDMPPPPPDFEEDFLFNAVPPSKPAGAAVQAKPPVSVPEDRQPKPVEPLAAAGKPAEAPAESATPKAAPPPAVKIESTPPVGSGLRYLVPPLPPEGIPAEESGEIRMVKVILRSSGDRERDVQRLKRVYGILRAEPGKDRFAFYVFEGNNRVLLEFPNDTTGITPRLLKELTETVGEGNVMLETIPIQ
ncbi:MAG: hypothetical protein ACOYXO_03125, partial [Chloroflexota bacterium]